MPRFFDDYSNTYLTHDSSAGRKQQRRGWKFRENFRLHYEAYVDDWRKSPMGLASAQQAYIRARGKDDPAVPPLPEGWKEVLDECTSATYYIDTATGKRTWVRPGFIPPRPGAGPPPPGVHHHHHRGGGPGGGPPPFRGAPPPPGGGGFRMPPPPNQMMPQQPPQQPPQGTMSMQQNQPPPFFGSGGQPPPMQQPFPQAPGGGGPPPSGSAGYPS